MKDRLLWGVLGSFLGAIGAAVATWFLGLPVFIDTVTTTRITEIINKHAYVVSPSDRPAAKNRDDPNWTASNECGDPSTQILLGWYCQIDTGGGNLQNAGADGKTSFHCTWNGVGGPFSAHARAICLSWK
jgi:hypothetical protein